MPWLDKEMLPVSLRCLYWDLEEFTKELQTTLYHIGGTQWHRTVTSDDDGPPATLSQALATYESTPGTTRDHVTMVASKWQGSVALLVNSWAKLARAATKLLNTCRDLATEADDKVATATARARELQVKAARDGTAQENMVELGQVLGGEEGARVVARPEARVRREAWVATSEATRATMVRQRVEAALGLLERLVAACDEATAFPREQQHLLRDIEATLEGTNEASPDVPEDLVAKVAEAERLWEANAHLAQDHLLQTVPDFTEFLFNSCPTGPRACEVAEQCQRAIEDIPRLVRPLERPQSVSKVSPVSKEPQELSSALLQPQVSVVAILGKLLATLPSQDKMKVVSTVDLYRDLEEFTKDLWATLYHIDGTWWCRDVTVDDDDPVTSLSQALAAYESTPWTPQNRVTMAASKWHTSVSVLMNSWAKLARKATKLRNACKRAVSEAADMVAATTARARHLQDMLARYWTAQENMVKLGQALGGEEGTKKLDSHEARVREQAMEATSKATRATMVRQRMEVALGLLERLVAVCDEATAFPRELQRLLRDIEAALKGTNEVSPDVPEALVAKVAMAERLWEANACLAKDHLLGAIDDIIKFFFYGGPTGPSACGVAERCQRAIKDISRLVQPPECPQSVPKVSPVSMEPQELLEAPVSVVATLGEVVATVTRPHRGVRLCVPPKSLHAALGRFTWSLREILDRGAVTSLGDSGVPSLSQALAALEATPGTTWADVRAMVKAWRESVAKLVDSWDWLAREATRLHEKEVMDQQLMVALDKEEVAREMATHDAQVSAATNEAMGEAVVATRSAMAATRRGHWVEETLGLLQRLVAKCDRATLFNWIMEWRLRDIETILKGTNDVSPDVLQALVAKVAKFELLWVASTRLAKDHLLGALWVIDNILLSPYGGHGVLGGPSSCAVAERCQKAIEDIPRLLGQ
ncbi:uncharacterized protein LOC132340486 [Haemorhous mexicanus]|uniref:uncharacterized protein LOC132340486 n=1 Tax=Haemorhous mexicanus TaxID=30427 RepID=UPI0028BF0B92|nr:uncharacterized protein LOC132340486 [Haemorhous mexicanus]